MDIFSLTYIRQHVTARFIDEKKIQQLEMKYSSIGGNNMVEK